jgi:hypothetical protein
MIESVCLLWRRFLLVVGHDCGIKTLHLVHVACLVLLNDSVVESRETCLRGLVIMAKLRALERIHRCCCWTCPLFDRRLRARNCAESSRVDGGFDDLHVEGTGGSLRLSTKTSADADY